MSLQDHGRAIIETTKDHLICVLAAAPVDGWTAAEWAGAAGLLVDKAAFPAVLAHHLAPILVEEGRAEAVGEGVLARYTHLPEQDAQEPDSAFASATSAPQVWGSAEASQVEVAAAGEFPKGVADDEQEQRPEGHEGPWIP